MMLSVGADLLGGYSTDVLTRRYGHSIGRNGVAGGSLFVAGAFLILGTAVSNPVAAVILLSTALASANFLLGAAWGTCVDVSGSHAGVVSAFMNTAGQIGGFICPIVVGTIVQIYSSWSIPLYLTGGLYILGASCWLLIDSRKPIV